MIQNTRVALFADTFHEINGAANILRRLVDFAKENKLPLLSIRCGRETKFEQQGSVSVLELKRSSTAIPIDIELGYDALLWRYKKIVGEKLKEFKPDVLHLTGFNDVSQIGFLFAHFQDIRAVASWHTNGHEYAASRCENFLKWLPEKASKKICNGIEHAVLRGSMLIHFLAQVQLAPNQELVEQIQKMTKRPSFLMSRGVDTEFLSPVKRCRTDKTFRLGYVGRLRPEKNVRFLAKIETALRDSGISDYQFVIIGEGTEDEWLKKNLIQVNLTGVLRGEDLASAYANMDLFVFPSKTDAFGNVVLEAMASGVPAVVMNEGGPKFLIDHEKNGFIAENDVDFCRYVTRILEKPEQLSSMKDSARAAALERSWTKVFENLWEKYHYATTLEKNVRV